MSADLLADLLFRWEEEYEHGKDIPAEELCKHCPELTATLAEQIATLKQADRLLKPVSENHPSVLSSGEGLGGRYRLDSLIGEGGFGQVWRAFDLELQRPVAVKLPREDLEQGYRFLAEARKLALLKHPGIVQVYDIGQHEGRYFIVSELVEGIDLEKRLQQGRLAIREAVRITVEVAEALNVAHEAGLCHRDIKPANILLDNTGQVHLTDFGIAVTKNELREKTEAVCGTLPYISPEQLTGQETDARTDIYSLGVLLHVLLTDVFPGTATVKVHGPAISEEARPRANGREVVPQWLVQIYEKCLAKDSSKRYASARELAAELREATAGIISQKEWLSCLDPLRMLNHLGNLDYLDPKFHRKVRLFACGCLRQVWAQVPEGASRRAVEMAERFAEGRATCAELEEARTAAWEVNNGPHTPAAAWTTDLDPWTAARETCRFLPATIQIPVLHDLFGPVLFRTVVSHPSWLVQESGTVHTVAKGLYENSAFERMGTLAQALKDAGCQDEEVLAHCLEPGPHFRGCWLLDLLLGIGSE